VIAVINAQLTMQATTKPVGSKLELLMKTFPGIGVESEGDMSDPGAVSPPRLAMGICAVAMPGGLRANLASRWEPSRPPAARRRTAASSLPTRGGAG
jgi:hypothetical protein